MDIYALCQCQKLRREAKRRTSCFSPPHSMDRSPQRPLKLSRTTLPYRDESGPSFIPSLKHSNFILVPGMNHHIRFHVMKSHSDSHNCASSAKLWTNYRMAPQDPPPSIALHRQKSLHHLYPSLRHRHLSISLHLHLPNLLVHGNNRRQGILPLLQKYL